MGSQSAEDRTLNVSALGSRVVAKVQRKAGDKPAAKATAAKRPATRAKPARKSAAGPPQPEPAGPRVYTDHDAEDAFTELPAPLDETLAVVRYTGRKRAYVHYGRAGDGTAFWYLIRSDGPRLLKAYPAAEAGTCFGELLAMMRGWREGVNPDPMSASYCDISPDEDAVERLIRSRYLGPAD